MKRKEKLMITLLIIITIIAIAMFIKMKSGKKEDIKEQESKEETVKILEDGTKLSTSSRLNEKKKFNGMEITNIQLTEKENVTLLLGTITNTSTTKQGDYPVDITAVDKNNKDIITISAYVPPLEPGESTQFSTNASLNFVNAYDFSISRKK